MAKISEVLKAAGLSSTYTEKVTKILQNSSEYGNKVVPGIMGATVTGDVDEIAAFVKEALNDESNYPAMATQRKEYLEGLYSEYEYYIEGCRGRTLWVFKDRIVINVEVTAGSIITGNITDGVKTIFYKDCIGVQFKEPGMIIGYLQVETASGMMNNNSSNFFNENTFTFDDVSLIEFVREVYEYICERVALYKKPAYSIPDEIRKYQELLKNKIISEEEFEQKKEELLSL